MPYIYFSNFYSLFELHDCADNELVTRLHTDDVRAFDTLYLRYHQALYSNILKLTKDAEATQDILQEVFIALWRKRLSLNLEQPVSSWLFVVSYNKTINYLKKTLRESVILKNLDREIQPFEERDMSLNEIQFELIEKAVHQLSPQKRKVFAACKLQGKSYEETAKELNLSRHTVKEYLSEAVTNVKEYIRQHPKSSTVFCWAAMLSASVS